MSDVPSTPFKPSRGIAPQVLGPKSLNTAVNYYAPMKPSDVEALWQRILQQQTLAKETKLS